MQKRILVVDDEPLILKSIEKALSKIGYEVRTAENREEFLKELESGRFSLLIFDLHMPDITRDEIVETSKKYNPEIKFMVVSGSEESAGFHFIRKPFRIDDLRQSVRDLLND